MSDDIIDTIAGIIELANERAAEWNSLPDVRAADILAALRERYAIVALAEASYYPLNNRWKAFARNLPEEARGLAAALLAAADAAEADQ